MASSAPDDAQPLGRLRRALMAVETPAEALLSVCASPAVVAALAAARPNPAAAADDAAELLRRVAAVAGTVQASLDALSGGQAVESRVTRRRAAGFASLPEAVALRIFAALPADQRARCAAVCRDWRAVLLQNSAWVHLDLSSNSGVTLPITDALVLAVSARARGQLQSLMLYGSDTSYAVMQQVVQANETTLRKLSYSGWLGITELSTLLAAAPRLDSACVCADAYSTKDAVRMLRNEAPFGPLQLHGLALPLRETLDVTPLPELFAAVSEHAHLAKLMLEGIALDADAVEALVDAVLKGEQLVSLFLLDCGVTAASIGALARLLDKQKRLQVMMITNTGNGGAAALWATADVAAFAAALAANDTLHTLCLGNMNVWHDMDAAVAMLQAATGHPSLEYLVLAHSLVEDAAQAGAQLAAVIAANAPALTKLDVDGVDFGDAGMAPVLDALAQNTHLLDLCCNGAHMSEAFARDRFLPGIQANTSLRLLNAGGSDTDVLPGQAFVQQAEALVAARAAADAAA